MIFPPAKVLRKVSLSLWMVAVLWERTAVGMRTSCCGTSAPNFTTAKKKAPDCGGLSHASYAADPLLAPPPQAGITPRLAGVRVRIKRQRKSDRYGRPPPY